MKASAELGRGRHAAGIGARGLSNALLNRQLLFCYVIAVPLVYYFEPAFCDGIGLVTGPWMSHLETGFTHGTEGFFIGLNNMMRGAPFPSVQWFLLAPVGLVFTVVFVTAALAALLLFVAAGTPAVMVGWLAHHAGPPRYLLDLSLVLAVGSSFYVIVFPILGMLVALTVGQTTYRRIQGVSNNKLRTIEAPHLLVALLCLVLLIPKTGVSELVWRVGEMAWQSVRQAAFKPLPPAWPMTFTVAAGQTVRTGVNVVARNEVRMSTTAQITLGITPPAERPVLVRKTDSASSTDCYPGTPQPGTCRSNVFVFLHPGEITLVGGATGATVQVWQPDLSARHGSRGRRRRPE